ncbi:MAG: hypothetical protein D6732_24980 [Methanobacteriota archaeon]|nr:MAG: hypothetical protein D6732_24980 [Euryarchaeota archaeon]
MTHSKHRQGRTDRFVGSFSPKRKDMENDISYRNFPKACLGWNIGKVMTTQTKVKDQRPQVFNYGRKGIFFNP